jgi:hypothetical protein
VPFAVAAPFPSFILPPAAAAYGGLAGVGDPTHFIWGMPYFFGRLIYVGIEQRAAGAYTGPFYAY